jgi:hypothetical protein
MALIKYVQNFVQYYFRRLRLFVGELIGDRQCGLSLNNPTTNGYVVHSSNDRDNVVLKYCSVSAVYRFQANPISQVRRRFSIII